MTGSRRSGPNSLLLSAAAAANHPDLLPLHQWFGQNLLLAEAGSRPYRWAFTAELLRQEDRRAQVLALWFTEKAHDGATMLAIGRRYLAVRSGAVPILAPEESTDIASIAPATGGASRGEDARQRGSRRRGR